ncbi:MAG TPA: hypothetical protein DGG94_10925, partial [Micromonosporaceae bacterium]|nr:hypothetical protein [Micromonosporaceae bacterium]
ANPLVSFSGGYLLRAEPEQIDLRLFEAELASASQARGRGDLDQSARMLSAALDRWRGQPLDGVPGPHAEQARARLAECRLAAMVQRIEVELARGRHADCVDELSRLVAAHPLREPLYGLLMLALYRSGRQAEALMVFHDARRKLADELGIEPCASLRDLFQRIITDDGPEMPSSDVYALGARKPRQLPPDLPDFAGREVELDQLTKHLAAVTTTAFCVIVGAGGIGKTALAIHAAHLVAERFPDGQLYLDLRGTGQQPLTPTEILTRLLTDLGASHQQVTDAEQLAALLRTCLSGKRILLVLNDAADATQIRLALPGSAGSAVLITSRVATAGPPGSQVIHLSRLDDEAARSMLVSIVGRCRADAEPEALQQIVGFCDAHPLALRVAGMKLTSRPSWTLAGFAERMSDEGYRLDTLGLRTAFRASYETLPGSDGSPSAAARVFRLLGSLPGNEISLHTAAALLDVPVRQAEQALELLVDTHLVQAESIGRYRFGDLLQLYAREQAHGQERPTALDALRDRALDHYCAVVREADLLMRPGRVRQSSRDGRGAAGISFRDKADAVQWCEAERASIVAVAVDAARYTRTDSSRLAGLLTELRTFLHFRGHWQNWQTLAELTIQVGRKSGDRYAEAVGRMELGTNATTRNQIDVAVTHLDESIEVFQEIGDELGERRALNNLGMVHNRRGRHAEAASVLLRCLELQRAGSDRDGEFIALGNLALTYVGQGDYERGQMFSEQCLRLHDKETSNLNIASIAFSALGTVHSKTGRHAEALQAMNVALELARAEHNRHREAYALTDLGSAMCAAGDTKGAIEPLDSALMLRRELGDEYGEEAVHQLLGKVQRGVH